MIGALGGDHHIDGRLRNETPVTQFFEQLLAVAPVVELIIGKNDVEGVALDLAQNLGGRRCAVD